MYAVIRQESAFNKDARSHAGALGLMQLMPKTGQVTAKKNNIPLPSTGLLYEPDKNITIGSAYLKQVMEEYDDNIVLASAAYNAGPHRVKRWLPKDEEKPAARWIAMVPFNETRNYIQRILAYMAIYDWRWNSRPHPLKSICPIFYPPTLTRPTTSKQATASSEQENTCIKTTICLTGGTGFVGQHLVNKLTQQGHRVRVLTRRRERHRGLIVNPAVTLIETDIHDADQLRQQFRGADIVINLVGILNESGSKGAGFRRAHVELPEKIVEAALDAGVSRLLHMSALNADADEQHSLYLKTKGEGENLVHAAASKGTGGHQLSAVGHLRCRRQFF